MKVLPVNSIFWEFCLFTARGAFLTSLVKLLLLTPLIPHTLEYAVWELIIFFLNWCDFPERRDFKSTAWLQFFEINSGLRCTIKVSLPNYTKSVFSYSRIYLVLTSNLSLLIKEGTGMRYTFCARIHILKDLLKIN